ncbi:MAG: dihydropteroate synthase [Roseivirga sp.]|jgi:dihydropteroate synthase|uniref:dihydropteroate synthase n=1 Tax=Roseivirga sp. TaxID=1964215 RepID=UPI001AFF54D5|nr:dihydropteroate synthase [Roseivirga sp.]MBO6495110.1 dihydropteroate synthase [Roseivirga sp.]
MSKEFLSAKDKLFEVKSTLNISGNLVNLDEPQVMGILNITPDSFYAESRVNQETAIIKKAQQMVEAGAFILDIGGYSTRPGADDISEKEETKRVTDAINLVRSKFPEILISVDTFRSSVAKHAIEAGANIINDVSGGNLDSNMFETVAQLKVPYILMHMRGTPQNMKSLNQYDDLLIDIGKELAIKCNELKQKGVADIIIDPGFGFAKSIPQNYELLQKLSYLKRLGYPLLAGLSRKSMIYKTLNIEPQDALNGTTALNMIALQNGASLLRVHDVKEAHETIKLFKALNT